MTKKLLPFVFLALMSACASPQSAATTPHCQKCECCKSGECECCDKQAAGEECPMCAKAERERSAGHGGGHAH